MNGKHLIIFSFLVSFGFDVYTLPKYTNRPSSPPVRPSSPPLCFTPSAPRPIVSSSRQSSFSDVDERQAAFSGDFSWPSFETISPQSRPTSPHFSMEGFEKEGDNRRAEKRGSDLAKKKVREWLCGTPSGGHMSFDSSREDEFIWGSPPEPFYGSPPMDFCRKCTISLNDE